MFITYYRMKFESHLRFNNFCYIGSRLMNKLNIEYLIENGINVTGIQSYLVIYELRNIIIRYVLLICKNVMHCLSLKVDLYSIS